MHDLNALVSCLNVEGLNFTAFAVIFNLCNDFGNFYSAS